MRLSRTALATSSRILKPPPLNLLGPLQLYRKVLRAHRHHLSPRQRILGDQYVKAEFRAHRQVENPVHIVAFLGTWQTYCQQIEGEQWQAAKFEAVKLEKLSEDQIVQMYELMQSAKET